VRLFVAVDAGERLRDTLATELDTWRRRWDLKWVRPGNLHVTLRFLGERPAEALPVLADALERAAARHVPFAPTTAGLGVFPDWRRPRVLFLRLDSHGALESLAASVDEAIGACPGEGRARRQAFRAHLTLARVKRPLAAADLADLRALAPPAPQPLAVRDIRLIESRLSARGARYVVRGVFPLAGPAPA